MIHRRFTALRALLPTLGFVGAMAAAEPAHAAGSVNGTTISELAVTNGKAWVRFASVLGGSTPSCVDAGWEAYFMFDPTTATGKALLTHLEAALLSGKRVDASGTGTCVDSVAEELKYLKVYAS